MNQPVGRARLARPHILIVGCGDVGLRLVKHLVPRFRVSATARAPQALAAIRALGARPLQLDLDAPILPSLALAAPWVVHLVPPPLKGGSDLRTRRLVTALRGVKRLVYVSTSGVYGDCHGALIDETRPVAPQSERAARRVDAEQSLKRYAQNNRVRLCILRVPGIYAGNRLPLERLRQGLPALIADEDVYTNHIHAEDLARIIEAALVHGRAQRIYHASDDSQLKMADYFDQVAKATGLDRPARLPMNQLAQRLTPIQLSFMRESRRLCNQRIKQELGVALQFPTVMDGLLQLDRSLRS